MWTQCKLEHRHMDSPGRGEGVLDRHMGFVSSRKLLLSVRFLDCFFWHVSKVRTWCKEWQLSILLPVTQGRVRSLALAWEQARAALQERQNSARTSPQISPRDAGSSGPPSAAVSPRQLDPPVPPGARPAHGSGQPPLPGGDSPVAHSRHGRSRSVPYLSPCDSAYDADGRPGRQQEKGGTTGDGDGPSVSPRSQSEAQLSPAKAGSMAHASAGGSPDRYYRHPPVSSVGLAKLQVSHLTLTCSDWETCALFVRNKCRPF